ncbi:zinc ribbon domain-containing protein [Anaeromyxobacter sp. PSR-1]|uniref:FmdB family zinc ribbon protein n=1 Tax=Anaeromyxobacter sp. PSR-1 TaxID=1300915 RepID=UPI0005E6F48A|nr:zinc ribbon domain protein [Anaeromyxobacter sp. PSR-1]
MIYEFQCKDCGAAFEVQATVAEKQRGLRVMCPSCGSPRADQVLSSFAVTKRSGRVGGPPRGCGPGAGGGCC